MSDSIPNTLPKDHYKIAHSVPDNHNSFSFLWAEIFLLFLPMDPILLLGVTENKAFFSSLWWAFRYLKSMCLPFILQGKFLPASLIQHALPPPYARTNRVLGLEQEGDQWAEHQPRREKNRNWETRAGALTAGFHLPISCPFPKPRKMDMRVFNLSNLSQITSRDNRKKSRWESEFILEACSQAPTRSTRCGQPGITHQEISSLNTKHKNHF